MSRSNTDPSNGDGSDFLYSGRLVEMKREENTVYARSLRRGEEDTGEGVHVGAGEPARTFPQRRCARRIIANLALRCPIMGARS